MKFVLCLPAREARQEQVLHPLLMDPDCALQVQHERGAGGDWRIEGGGLFGGAQVRSCGCIALKPTCSRTHLRCGDCGSRITAIMRLKLLGVMLLRWSADKAILHPGNVLPTAALC